ncbi:GtrA family protein [bacterium]|nr:GtrA family protein [bacterium]
MDRNKYKLLLEYFRYVLVGGSAFVIDLAVMYIFNEFIFNGKFLHLSVFIGYTVGLIYNFLLSCKYVFENGFEKIKNKEIQSFIIFTIIGIIGLFLTELLMHIFVIILGFYYVFSKIITGAIVMFWNYYARKVIIFK